MSISEELTQELQQAIRSGDTRRKDVIRQIQTEITKTRTQAGFSGEVDDQLYQRVIKAFVGKMSKAVSEYQELGERGEKFVEKLEWEIGYLSQWLPQTLDRNQTEELVSTAITELGGTEASLPVGQVIGHIMKKKLPVDGALVSRLVTEALSEPKPDQTKP